MLAHGKGHCGMKMRHAWWWLAGLTAAFCFFLAWSTPGKARHEPSGANAMALTTWQETMLRSHLHELGCFHAKYPQTAWKRVPCQTGQSASPGSLTRASSASISRFLEGSYTDYALKVPQQGLQLVSATGSFDSFTDAYSSGSGAGDLYSLQIRTLPASPSDACNGHAGCRVGVTFNYNNDSESIPYFEIPSFGVYIQYVLLNYNTDGKGCPDKWVTDAIANLCFKFSDNKTTVPGGIALKDLKGVTLQASVNSSVDEVMVSYGKQSYAVTSPDSVVGLSKIWDGAEFNVFGQESKTKLFSPGVSASVKLQATYSDRSPEEPICVRTSDLIGNYGNNLKLGKCVSTGGPPQIIFTESN